MSLQGWGWFGLVVVLSVSSFGLWTCWVFIICFAIFFAGAVLLLFAYNAPGSKKLEECLQISKTDLPESGVPQAVQKAQLPVKKHKQDRRLTGSTIIDEPLQEVLQYAFRDYILTWYGHITTCDSFVDLLRDMVQKAIVTFSSRAKDVEWVPYLTTRLVDDFASHLRLFRQAQTKLKERQVEDPASCSSTLISLFFDLETTMEQNLCRDLVCTSSEAELEYLQNLSEVILYLLLPVEEFNCKPVRLILREILVSSLFLPLINLLSNPDYINQTIVWLCRDAMVTSEGFMTVLRCTDNQDELVAVREIVNHEIAVQRSRDTGGVDDTEIKQQLSSLLFVQRVVNTRWQRLQEGNLDTDSTGLPSQIDWKRLMAPGVKLFSLPFDVVLKNNIAVSYFIEYMTSIGAQNYIIFYLNVEGFKASAEQQLSMIHLARVTPDQEPPDLENLRETAKNIYETYLSEKACPRVRLDDVVLKKLYTRIRTETPNESWFDEAQEKVFEIMQEERFFPSFKNSSSYIKLLAELDLLKDSGFKSDDEDGGSSPKAGYKLSGDDSPYDSLSLSSLEQGDETLEFFAPGDVVPNFHLCPLSATIPEDGVNSNFTLSAEIYNTGIVKEAGHTYAVYAISVTRRNINTFQEDKWFVFRRYSDFYDFHLLVVEKFPHLSSLHLPGKKTFNNLSRQFLERRTHMLNEYLQRLLSHHTLSSNKGLWEMVIHFLEPGSYEKGKGQLTRTMGNLVNPLKCSVKSVSQAVKTMPDNLIDGLRDGLSRVLGSRFSSSLSPGLQEGKVAAGIDVEADDNIPLRIMLLLMDEVFDLKSKNQWLRRRIVVLLRQIIKATFGDTINRKIIDYVEWITSAEQVAEYVKSFKQSFWPNGSLAAPQPPRDHSTNMRTRVAAKLVLLCSLSDELKHIIGSETTRKGLLCVFEMFQYPELNRRLVYVLLEGMLETLFPGNNFPEIFQKLHSRSSRTSTDSLKWPPGTDIAGPKR